MWIKTESGKLINTEYISEIAREKNQVIAYGEFNPIMNDFCCNVIRNFKTPTEADKFISDMLDVMNS